MLKTVRKERGEMLLLYCDIISPIQKEKGGHHENQHRPM